MDRTVVRQIVTDKLFIATGVFYALLTIANFTVSFRSGLIWSGVLLAVLASMVGVLHWRHVQRDKFRAELDSIAREANARRYEHDLKMERLAQETDVLSVDSERRLASIRAGDGDPGPSDLARRIGERRSADLAESARLDREQRQARIAAHEAHQLDV